MPPFGAFPPFSLPPPTFSSLNSFAPSTSAAFPPPPSTPSAPSLLSNDLATSSVWSNGLPTANTNIDYNEYTKQLGLLVNAFNEQAKQSENEKSKSR